MFSLLFVRKKMVQICNKIMDKVIFIIKELIYDLVPQIKPHPNSGHYTLINYLGQKLNAELIKSAAEAKV